MVIESKKIIFSKYEADHIQQIRNRSYSANTKQIIFSKYETDHIQQIRNESENYDNPEMPKYFRHAPCS